MPLAPQNALRIAAIRFLNPAPLMWDFEHPPLSQSLAERYQVDWMLPSECADRLAEGAAEIGLVPIAALAHNPELRILPGCTIASKDYVRSLLLVRRSNQPLTEIRTVGLLNRSPSNGTLHCALSTRRAAPANNLHLRREQGSLCQQWYAK